ncbi:glutamyl-tRNA(Gln) amidotransferase subunit A, mitochondrial isoform X2 [Diorhabda sublineata]|uniref:glutamyl-tRNA(Gln) amidotransferase subunit A, mitochondrial isoform X2 n=1 Tax=Diorhabda sublineata TaxID=1163346 RepID=UPI0024E0E0BE|nr:glutamyl-tRNA(Gln) amidotransferase subunit A, mitochondrial isoform X2 [Diorhabda sublineata]
MEKLLHTNIKTISRLLFDGTIKPTELTNLALKKAEDIKHLNSFISITSNQAKTQGEKSEKRFTDRKPISELDGVTIAVKDNFCTQNIKTTCASKMLENFVPTYNATVCQRLFDAGAVLIGKTNLDEFAMGSATTDSIYGPTKNIWRAIGSDTGGSTRNPASYCGVVGLKPTYGLVSRWGLIPLVNSMDVPGILARTVDDVVSVLNVIAGFDNKDSTSLTKPYNKIRLPPATKMSIKGLKIGIPIEYNSEHVSEEVLDTWNEIAALLQSHGAVIKKVSMPHTEYSIVCYSILNQCEVASNMARYDGIEYGFRANEELSTEKLYAASRKLGFNDVVKNRILCGNYFLLTRNYDKYFTQALKIRRLIANDFHNVWNDVSLLLTPTTLSEAPSYKSYIENYDPYKNAFEDFCTQCANMAGVPAVSIPIKLSKNVLPLSLQLMGRNLSEPMLLAVAKYIENLVKFPHFQYEL